MSGIYDYSTTANSNTNVGGVFIGELCPAANLNDGIRAVMADIAAAVAAGVLTAATAAEIWSVAASNHQLNTTNIQAAAVPTSITDSATLTVDLSTGFRFLLTKSVNGSMALTNAKVGYTYRFVVTQDGTGSRTLSQPTASGVTVKTKGGWPGLSANPGVIDVFDVFIASSTSYLITVAKGYA
jgi:hypothetical protein